MRERESGTTCTREREREGERGREREGEGEPGLQFQQVQDATAIPVSFQKGPPEIGTLFFGPSFQKVLSAKKLTRIGVISWTVPRSPAPAARLRLQPADMAAMSAAEAGAPAREGNFSFK